MSFRLELVPCHNENARRKLPLTLGRCELAKWWWHSCSCAKHVRATGQPCFRCKRLAKSIKSLSKKMLYITKNGCMTVVSRKNRNLLWYNGQPMVKSSDTTPILLQSGDSISIGHSPKDAWMEFYVTRVPIVVTPESETKNANIIARAKRNETTSRKRLYYTCPLSSSLESKESSSEERLSFTEPRKDSFKACTQNMTGRDSNLDEQSASSSEAVRERNNGAKRPRKVAMSPRRLIQAQNDDGSVEQASEAEKSKWTQNEHSSKKIDASGESSFSEVADAWITKRKRPRGLIGVQENSRRAMKGSTANVTKTARKETLQRTVPSTAESNETSVLSLPQCPTWDDDEEDDGSSNSIQSASFGHGRPLNSQQGPSQKAAIARAFQTAGSSQASPNVGSQEQDDSPSIQFASALSLTEWKHLQRNTTVHNETGRVRKALASLVVAQRTRDSTWFPAILEGAVVD